MKIYSGWLPVLLTIIINFQWTCSLPVSQDQTAINNEERLVSRYITVNDAQERAYAPKNQPPSPIHFFGTDKIYYYTHDKHGAMVVKEMTEKEIQSLIAAGGGSLPVPVQEPSKIEEHQPEGTKVSDVVTNVKKVVGSELSKPSTTITAIPTIPGHANSEWSNILPSILSGEPDTGVSSQPILYPEESAKPSVVKHPDVYQASHQELDEKPMIPVPMITVEKPSHHEKEKDGKPVYEILNTIPAEKAGTTSVNQSAVDQDQIVGASEAVKPVLVTSSTSKPESLNNDKNYHDILHTAVSSGDISNEQYKKDTVSVIAESSSTSVKVSGQDEIKIHHEEILKPYPVSSTTQKFSETPEMEQVELKIHPTKPPIIEEYTEKSTSLPETYEFSTTLKPIDESSYESSGLDTSSVPNFDKNYSSSDSSNSKIPVDLNIEGENDVIKEISQSLSNVPQVLVDYVNFDVSTSTINPDDFTDSSTSNFNFALSTEKTETNVKDAEIPYFEVSTFKPTTQSTKKEENISSKPALNTEKTSLTKKTSVKWRPSSTTESMSQELTDSISSMINQVSEVLPSRISSEEQQTSKDSDSSKITSEIESKESAESNEFKIEELTTTEAPLSTIDYEPLSETKSPILEDFKPEEKVTEINYPKESSTQVTGIELEVVRSEETDLKVNKLNELLPAATTTSPSFVELKEPSVETATINPEIQKLDDKNPIVDMIKETSNTSSEDTKLSEKRPELSNKFDGTQTSTEIASTEESVLEVKDSSIDLTNEYSLEKTTLKPIESIKYEEKTSDVTTPMIAVAETMTTSSEKNSDSTPMPEFIEIKISQVPEKPSEVNKLNETTASKEGNQEQKENEKIAEISTESPIVRINVTEPNMQQDQAKKVDDEKNITESTMVRIKLTNPVSKIQAMIESAVQESTPAYENLTLPPIENLSANQVGSGLIAGFEPNMDNKTSVETEMPMQTIQFDQLPIVNNSATHKNFDSIALTEEPSKETTTELTASTVNEGVIPLEAENKENIAILLNETLKNSSLNSLENPKPTNNLSSFMTSTEKLSELPDTSTLSPKIETDVPLSSSVVDNILKPENTLVFNDSTTEIPLVLISSTKIPRPDAENSNPTPSEIQTRPKDQKKETGMEILEKGSTLSPNALPKSEETSTMPTENPEIIKITSTLTPSDPTNWVQVPQLVDPAVKNPIELPAVSKTPEGADIQPSVALDHSKTTPGLDTSTQNLDPDISYFVNLCNDLAFSLWNAINTGLSTSRSLAVSPFGMTSMLAMIFLGARGTTSNQMNNVLKLDDVSSFNPHLVFQNVSDSVSLARNQGVANAVFVRELFADKLKVRKLLPFYKEQAQQFYDGIVAEVNFAFVSDVIRRRTNLMVRKQTGGRIRDFVKSNPLPLRSPLAALSANVFQTDCSSGDATSEGRDGELYFAVSPAVRQRKLIPVPATLWKAGVLAGYEPNLDATAIALGGLDKMVSTIFIVPGQPGATAPGDNLYKLEQRLVDGALHDGSWNKLLKVIIPRPDLELQIPKFSHRSIINATTALKSIKLQELFNKHADLKGINGIGHDLHLADVFQMNLFSTCGDENVLSGKHHEEIYPASPQRNARSTEVDKNIKNDDEYNDDIKYYDNNNDDKNNRLAKFSRQVNDEKPRLKLDRPFLYLVRHNPTGLILYMGRFNPRLLP